MQQDHRLRLRSFLLPTKLPGAQSGFEWRFTRKAAKQDFMRMVFKY